MKLIDVLDAGYTPTSIKDSLIECVRINHEYGVVQLVTAEGPNVAVALTKDVSDLEMDFVMHVKFNENIAAALMLSGVAPVGKEDLDVEYKRKQATLRREVERKSRERR